jgi:hypothetical protein
MAANRLMVMHGDDLGGEPCCGLPGAPQFFRFLFFLTDFFILTGTDAVPNSCEPPNGDEWGGEWSYMLPDAPPNFFFFLTYFFIIIITVAASVPNSRELPNGD